MKQQLAIRRLNLLASSIIILLMASVISYLLISNFHLKYTQQTAMIEKNMVDSKKAYIRSVIESIIQTIESDRRFCEVDGRKSQPAAPLPPKPNTAGCDENFFKEMAKNRIRELRLKEDGYIWINQVLNYDGGTGYAIRLVHPNLQHTEGMLLSTDMKDVKGNFPYKTELEGVKQNGEIFFEYWFKKLNSPKIEHKLTFAKLYKRYDWIIATGVYLDDVEEEILFRTENIEVLLRGQIKRAVLTGAIFVLLALGIHLLFQRRIDKTISWYSDSMRQREEELERLNATLEEKVKSRTKDIRESEKRFRNLAENISEVFWISSPRMDEFDYISPAFEKIWQCPRTAIYETPSGWFESIVEQDRPSVVACIQKYGKIPFSGISFPEYRIRRPDGSICWIHARAFPLRSETDGPQRLTGIAQDITERKNAEIDFQALVESASGVTGQYFFNKVVENICDWLGFEIAMIGRIEGGSQVTSVSLVVDGEHRKEPMVYNCTGTPCEKVATDGFSVFPDNVAKSFPQDKMLEALGVTSYVGTTLKDRTGQPIGIICAMGRKKGIIRERTRNVFDIIAARASAELERTKIENEKEEYAERLRQSQKMEAIGTLAGGIAHDFNNMLAIILGNTEIGLEDLPEGHPTKHNLEEILHASLRAKDVIYQILSFARRTESEKNPMYVEPIVTSAVKLLRASIPAGIDIQAAVDEDASAIMANPAQINQILINLGANAADAMRSKGTEGKLRIEVQNVHLRADLQTQFTALPPGQYLRISVSDTGTGIDQMAIQRIFEPYFTTKDVDKGTGIGLAVVHGILENHGGGIIVESAVGQGTRIDVYFPAVEYDAGPEAESAEAAGSGHESILLIDDESSVLKITGMMLERLGYRVVSTNEPEHALQLFKEAPDSFDLVITDMAMPVMGGDRLAEIIRAIRGDIPIILCTGYSDSVSEDHAMAIGINAYLEKPITKRRLGETVRSLLDGSPDQDQR